MKRFLTIAVLSLGLTGSAYAETYQDEYLQMQMPPGWAIKKERWVSQDGNTSFVVVPMQQSVEECLHNVAAGSDKGSVMQAESVTLDGLPAKRVTLDTVKPQGEWPSENFVKLYVVKLKNGQVLTVQFAYDKLWQAPAPRDPEETASLSRAIDTAVATLHWKK